MKTKTKEITKYVWRGDNSMQYRISYIPERGGVEVVDPNGYPKREEDARNAKEAKKIMVAFEKQIIDNQI